MLRTLRLVLAPLLLAACAPTQTTPLDAPLALPPRWATPERYVGAVATDEPITLQIHLKLHDADDARATLAAISNPRGDRFRRYLSDAELESRFAPRAEDVAAVRAHLEAHGLRVTYVPSNRSYVTVEGTASQVERAFATRLGLYQIGAETRHAPLEAVRAPQALAAYVLGVLGLSTPREMRSRNVTVGGLASPIVDGADPDATASACAQYFGALTDTTDPTYIDGTLPIVPCGYTPPQLRHAYGFDDAVANGVDGTGVKVAIVDAFLSPTLLQDAQTYATNHDPGHPLDPAHFSAQMGPGTPPAKVSTGWFGEQTLDVEAVHAMAPGATIVYVGAQSASDQDLIGAINLIVSQSLASIVSNSYGSVEAGSTATDLEPWRNVALLAGLKGIGLYFSSGDNGDESADNDGVPTPDFPASLDDATAVGGTSLALRASGRRLFELGWETGVSRLKTTTTDGGTDTSWQPAAPGEFAYGAGGGVSSVYAQPDWQKWLVPDSLARHDGSAWRVVPDVAMLADPDTGFLIGQTSPRKKVYGESSIGGTSLACPLFAASMALAEQYAHEPIGFANPTLYTAAWLGALRDIEPAQTTVAAAIPGGGVAVTFDFQGQSIKTGYAYDDVTGLGVPDGWRFLESTRLVRWVESLSALEN
jgi:subtilase family serine protease